MDPSQPLPPLLHQITIEAFAKQHLENGAITVWVNEMEQPLMTAQDRTYPPGRIGFGAFDDRAAFAVLQF